MKKHFYSFCGERSRTILIVAGSFFATALPGFSQSSNIEPLIIKAKEHYALRDDTANLREAIVLLEQIVTTNPDYNTLVFLSHCCYFMGEKTSDVDAKLAIHNKGFKYGDQALRHNEGYSKAMDEKKDLEETLKLIGKDQIEGIYWAAANLARWAKFNSFGKKVSAKPKMLALWGRVLELDPTFFFGGAYRFFGGYHALAPSITGDNDPVKAKGFFDKGVEAAPQYLETKVLFAEAYCCHAKIKDRELFKKLLDDVLKTDLNLYPDIVPENKLAQEKARKLIEKESELFE